jgi:hypothetical protein
MKRIRTIPFLLFLMCLVAAMPYALGQVGLEAANLEPFASFEGAKIDAVKVGVTLCHIPPGNPANAQTIVVGQAAVAAHLAHGDYLGECHPTCEVGVPSPVSKTGQTLCFDAGGSLIDCVATGQDGEYQTGVSVDPRFTDNADGTVTDNLTGLIWLKNVDCFGHTDWIRGLDLLNTLSSGACGLSDGSVVGDWRMPNVKELQSLIDYGQFNPALPPGNPFSGVPGAYWSSSAYVYLPDTAWLVDLYYGRVTTNLKSQPFLVWPVRGGR